MHFRLKMFMPFAVIGALLVVIALTTPPHIYSDKAFTSAKNIEHEIQSIKSHIGDSVDMDPSARAELPRYLNRIEEEVETILHDSRWRQLWFSSLLVMSAGVLVILTGLFTTLIASWKADIRVQQARKNRENKTLRATTTRRGVRDVNP